MGWPPPRRKDAEFEINFLLASRLGALRKIPRSAAALPAEMQRRVILPTDGIVAGKNRPDDRGRLQGRAPQRRRTIDFRRIRFRRLYPFSPQLLRAAPDPVSLPESLGRRAQPAAVYRHRRGRRESPPIAPAVHPFS